MKGKKDKAYYVSRIRRIIEGCVCSSLRAKLYTLGECDKCIDLLMCLYTRCGIDYLLDSLEIDMRLGLYDVSVRAWDRIIDYDYLIHHC